MINEYAIESWASRENRIVAANQANNFAIFLSCAMLLALFGVATIFLVVASGWLP